MRIGRRENADPKWLLPMLCRRGNVTRQEIGAIRIFERETKFEVAASAADRFAHAVRKADGDIEIVPLREGGAAAPTERPAKHVARPKREEHARTERPARPPRKDFKPDDRKEFQPKPGKKKRRPPPAR